MSEKYLLENCEAEPYLSGLPDMGENMRAMTVNGAFGWSAALE